MHLVHECLADDSFPALKDMHILQIFEDKKLLEISHIRVRFFGFNSFPICLF